MTRYLGDQIKSLPQQTIMDVSTVSVLCLIFIFFAGFSQNARAFEPPNYDCYSNDCDGDGILNTDEYGLDLEPVDTDGDGIPDYRDHDSDNDGISDNDEAQLETRCAGRNCYEFGPPGDYDGDLIPNFRDLDSDNDGLSDSIEAGDYGFDSPEKYYLNANVLHQGELDTDKDGVMDMFESSGDTDGDGLADYLDRDSDNDGLLDADEGANGAHDGFEDTDSDGVTDQLDLDSDNDGLSDAFETHGRDLDGDGQIDDFLDANSDGAHDMPIEFAGIGFHKDLDSDDDGITDVAETLGENFDRDRDGFIDPGLEFGAFNQVVDTDGDGLFNHQDLDKDNNGVYDLVELGGSDVNDDGIVDYWTDSDEDGLEDWADADIGERQDHDNDGVANFADVDCYRAATGEYFLDNDNIIDGYKLVTWFEYEFPGPSRRYTNESAVFHPSLGYVHPKNNQQGHESFEAVDTNRNCVPDAEEVLEAETPPSISEPNTGAALTDNSRSGCTVLRQTGASQTYSDPTFLAMLILGGIGALKRRPRKREY